MSVIIRGVEMPVSCARCPCANDESRYCRAANKYIPMLSKPDFCPLAEFEEQKKGKWKQGYCSECGYDWGKVAPLASVPDFCPNCGAEMKGEDDEAD